MSAFVSNLDIFVFLQSSGGIKSSDNFYKTLLEHIPSEVSSEDVSKIKKFCCNYTLNLNKRWQDASRTESRFRTKNMSWLESKVSWPVCETVDLFYFK